MLTFEEVAGMFAAKEVDFNAVEVDENRFHSQAQTAEALP